MADRLWLPAAAALIACSFVSTACTGVRSQAPPVVEPVATPPLAPASPAPTPVDPILLLIDASQQRFDAGRAELVLGHLERAKAEFTAALDLLLESPHGARLDARLRQHFDGLVDRISALEAAALADGDGFVEQRSDAASIDELLAIATFEPPPPALAAAVASDLRTTVHDVPIPLNTKVLSYIDLFQGQLREWVEEGLSRGARYLPMIQQVFQAEGLPLDLAYLPLVESAFKPTALSRAKARGVWQFMRGTAVQHGLRHDWYIDERSDPEKATVAAAKYLKSLVRRFDGDWHLALASYNGGPGLVQRALKRSRVNDFWALAARPRALPRETREYVPMLLAAIVVSRNPGQYGLEVVPEPPIDADRVPLAGPVDLRRVAEWTGTTIDVIQRLNPELRRWTTPVRYPGYQLKVPKGTGAGLAERLAVTDAGELTALQWYVVKRGDTLASIAGRLKVKRADLAEANYLSARARLAVGQRLVVPRAPTTLLAAVADRPAPQADARPVPVPSGPALGAVPGPEGADVARLVYRVKPGDTLSSIARLFRTSVDAIRRWNGLDGSLIKPGDRLTILTAVQPPGGNR